MPLRLIVCVAPLDELLVIVTVPVSVAAVVGSNVIVIGAVCPGLSVIEPVTPDIANPVPEIDAELMVTGAVPLELSVTTCVVAVFRFTLPKATLVVFRLSPAIAAFSCNG